MKPTYILPLLAFAIAPALSKPYRTAIENTLATTLTSRADNVPFACTKANTIIESQLAEISQLQSSHLPVPPDLAGYFYSVVYGRKLLGCPSTPILSAHSKRSGVINDHPEVRGDPCKVLRVLYDEVIDPIHVLKRNNIPVRTFRRWSIWYWSWFARHVSVQTDHFYSRDQSCDAIISLEEAMLTPKCAKVPAYLAGFWSSVSDAEKHLNCGFAVSSIIGGNSTASSNGPQ